jgi:hypothetical protein
VTVTSVLLILVVFGIFLKNRKSKAPAVYSSTTDFLKDANEALKITKNILKNEC